MAKKTPTFEQQLDRLETIVRQLERGDAPLDQSLALFEEGTALISRCSALLDAAEQTVVRIKKGTDGAPIELPFEDAT